MGKQELFRNTVADYQCDCGEGNKGDPKNPCPIQRGTKFKKIEFDPPFFDGSTGPMSLEDFIKRGG